MVIVWRNLISIFLIDTSLYVLSSLGFVAYTFLNIFHIFFLLPLLLFHFLIQSLLPLCCVLISKHVDIILSSYYLAIFKYCFDCIAGWQSLFLKQKTITFFLGQTFYDILVWCIFCWFLMFNSLTKVNMNDIILLYLILVKCSPRWLLNQEVPKIVKSVNRQLREKSVKTKVGFLPTSFLGSVIFWCL